MSAVRQLWRDGTLPDQRLNAGRVNKSHASEGPIMNTKMLFPVFVAILVTMGALIVGGISVEQQDYQQSDAAWQVADWNSRPGCVIWYASDGAAGNGSTGYRSPDADFHQRGCVNFH